MPRWISWVEWLAIALVAMGVFLFLFREDLAALAPPPSFNPAFAGFGGISPAGAVEIEAIYASVLSVLAGLSLFLVRPLLWLAPRFPYWLFPAAGVLVFWFNDPVCRAISNGDIHSALLYDCRDDVPFAGILAVLFGIVFAMRQLQVSRNCEGNTSSSVDSGAAGAG